MHSTLVLHSPVACITSLSGIILVHLPNLVLRSIGRLVVGTSSDVALYQLGVEHDLPSWTIQWCTRYTFRIFFVTTSPNLMSQSVHPSPSGVLTLGLPTRPSYSTIERPNFTRKHRPANPNPPAPAPPQPYNLAYNTFQQGREHSLDDDHRPRTAHLLSCTRRPSPSTTARHCRPVCLFTFLNWVEFGLAGLLDEPSGDEERMRQRT